MPNWCDNRVEIYGFESDEEQKAFIDFVSSDDSEFDFNKIIPMPEALEDTTKGTNHVPSEELKEKYGFDNWYDWRLHNWGTKWEANDIVEAEINGDYIMYNFQTPWGPPEGIYRALRDKFPDIEVSWFYDEPGVQIAGYL